MDTPTPDNAARATSVAWVDEAIRSFTYCPNTGRISRVNGQFSGPADTALCKGYRLVYVAGKSMKAHRVAWAIFYGEAPQGPIDHINGDRQDNRISNLRDGALVNNFNRRLIPGRTLPKGVWPEDGRLRAMITANGRKITLGMFDDVDEAAHAYNKGAIRHHGEGASLNPIGIWDWKSPRSIPLTGARAK